MDKKKNGQHILLTPAVIGIVFVLSGGFAYAGQKKTEENCSDKIGKEAIQEKDCRTDTTWEMLTEGIAMSDDKTHEKDKSLLSQELEKADTQELERSLERLYKRGCSDIEQIERVKEEKGLIYLVVTDTDGDLYYVDTNNRGIFGTVLSQTGYDNVQLLADSLGIETGRELLYTAEQMEDSCCGKIVSVEDITDSQAFRFTIINDQDEKYIIRMEKDGSLGDIQDEDGHDIYAMIE